MFLKIVIFSFALINIFKCLALNNFGEQLRYTQWIINIIQKIIIYWNLINLGYLKFESLQFII